MDNEKKDDVFNENDQSMGMLPLDFPDDDEDEEEVTEISVEEESSEKVVIESEEVRSEAKQESKSEEIPPPAKKDTTIKEIQIQGNFLPGQILQEGRVRADLSVDQVAQETKIKKQYINFLELGDEENLPPKVYVEAYIKQLCRLYKIDSRQVIDILKEDSFPVKSKKVPGELISDIEKGKQVNFREEIRVRKFFKIVAAVIVIVVLTAFLIFKLAIPSWKKSSETVENPVIVDAGELPEAEEKQLAQSITSNDLEVFLVNQPFTMTEINVPQ